MVITWPTHLLIVVIIQLLCRLNNITTKAQFIEFMYCNYFVVNGSLKSLTWSRIQWNLEIREEIPIVSSKIEYFRDLFKI